MRCPEVVSRQNRIGRIQRAALASCRVGEQRRGLPLSLGRETRFLGADEDCRIARRHIDRTPGSRRQLEPSCSSGEPTRLCLPMQRGDIARGFPTLAFGEHGSFGGGRIGRSHVAR
jgi:hypothetical protein